MTVQARTVPRIHSPSIQMRTGVGGLGSFPDSSLSARFGSPPQGLCGTLNNDDTAGVTLKSVRLTSIIISGTHSTICGVGVVNGTQEVDFRIDVDDLGEPGRSDRFSISWPGYGNDGVLNGGNVQVSAAR